MERTREPEVSGNVQENQERRPAHPFVESCAELVLNHEAIAPVLVPVNLVTPEAARTLLSVETNSVVEEEEEDEVEPDEVDDDEEPDHQHLLSLR